MFFTVHRPNSCSSPVQHSQYNINVNSHEMSAGVFDTATISMGYADLMKFPHVESLKLSVYGWIFTLENLTLSRYTYFQHPIKIYPGENFEQT